MNPARVRLLVLGAAVLLAGTGPAAAAPLTLAEGGKTAWTIVLPAEPTAGERLAAEELAAYLKRMSGAVFPVRSGGDIPEFAILLARPAARKGPPPAPDAPRPEPGEGYSLQARAGRLTLTAERDRGFLYAVYDLLDRLGCRWLAPRFGFYGDTAEGVPSRPTLTLDLPNAVREAPRLKLRKLYVEEGHSHTAENLARLVEWMPKLRFNTLVVPADYQGRGRVRWDNWRQALTPELQRRDLIVEVGGHGYQNFLNAEMDGGIHWERHPEWFGQDAQGQRRKEHARVFCTSNPEAVRFVIDRFQTYVKERPEIRIYDFWPPDGARWCECAPCLALGSPSERHAQLVNQVQAAAARVRPGLRLECLAYSSYVTPPEKTKLDPAVLLDFCPIAQSFEVQIDDPYSAQNAAYAAAITAWRQAFTGEISLYSYYRKYAWKSLPVVFPEYVQRDLRWYFGLPLQGVSSYAEPGDWATYELNHYALGQLAWNSAVNVPALVQGFCEARFGPAAEAARGVYAVLGRVVRTHGSLPGTRLKAPEQIRTAALELRDAVEKLQAAPAAPAVERLLLAAEYARRDLEIQEARAVRKPPAEIRTLVESLAAFLAAHAERGVFLPHARLEVPRLLQTYGQGAPRR